MLTLGLKIKALRERRGWTQVKLSLVARCSQQTIDKIENGRSLKPRYLPDIAGALGLTVEQLLTDAKSVADFLERVDTSNAKTESQQSAPPWPFRNIEYKTYENLEKHEKLELESCLLKKIKEIEDRNIAEESGGKDRAKGRGKKSLHARAA